MDIDNKNNNLNSRNIVKLFIKLLPVQIFIPISSSLSSLINGGIVGNALSSTDMMALGLISPFIAILSAIASIFSGGMGIISGNLMGKGENKKINLLFTICANSLLVLGLIISAVTVIFKEPISILCGASELNLASTASYLSGICIGIIPTLLIPCLMTLLQMSNESYFSLASAVLLAIFNLLLDLLAIYVFKTGVFGIGVASSIANYLTLFVILIYIRKKNIVEYYVNQTDFNVFKQTVFYGLPFALGNFCYSVRNIFINNISASIGGAVAVGALAILSSVGGFIDSINIGIGPAYRMLASVYVGEKDSHSLKTLFDKTFIISEIIILVKCFLMIVFSENIALAFGATGETIEMTKYLIKLYAYSSPPNILTIYLISTHITMGRSTYCNVMYLINALIAPLLCCYISSYTIGIEGVFSCYYISEFVVLICIYALAFIKHKKVIMSFNELFDLDNTFDTDNRMFISIRNNQEVVDTSIKVEEFCKNHHIDDKRAKLAGLCLEEMASNIVVHGFNKDNKKHSVDIFVCADNDEILIRIKDDCVAFNPKSRDLMFNPEDPCKNIGIRLVAKKAKQMNYQSTFGMNVLTITL